MEKRGVIDDHTPAEEPKPAPPPGEPTTKEAADQADGHLTKRLSDAVKTDKSARK